MKKILLTVALVAMTIAAKATLTFQADKTYRFFCSQYITGGIVLGAEHGQNTPLYYLNTSTIEEDMYWTITDMGSGKYTFKNAKSGQYMTYCTEYTTEGSGGATQTMRYMELNTTLSGNKSLWTIEDESNGYVIKSVENPRFRFNIRSNFVVGAYETGGNASGNEIFMFYDNDGQLLTDSESGGTDGEIYGTTDDGFYWENTNVAAPILYTENPSDPVYYYIKNLRSGKYVGVQSSWLTEATSKTTKFYFVLGSDGGTNIYTDGGKYVSGAVPSGSSSMRVSVSSGSTTTSDNTWTIGYYNTSNKGYSMSVRTCTANDQWNANFTGGKIYWNDNSSTSTINFYTADAGGTFIFYSDDERHRDLLLSYGYSIPSNGNEVVEKMSVYVDSLTIGGKVPSYDNLYKTYLQPLQSKYHRKSYTATIKYKLKRAGNYALYIDGTKVDNGGQYTFAAVDGGKGYTFEMKRNETDLMATDPITFTFMPVVEVTCASFNGSSYNTGKIKVNDAENNAMDSLFIADYKYRGATAQSFPKKSFAIKLRDSKGESVDRSFLGLRNDNNWILDAAAVDRSRMRNRVSTDLWLDFSAKPYHYSQEPNLINGTRGHFVEVLINGSYAGIYCMTEKVDRKQLKLKKMQESTKATTADTIRGVLYKSSQWSYSVFMGHNAGVNYYPMTSPSSYSTNSETWDGWEIKYPDMSDMKETLSSRDTLNWRPLWNAVNYIATQPRAQILNDFNEWYDIPVVRDYYLFIELLLATDNHGKNMHLFNYNTQKYKKTSITPWDLDGTWGRRWDGGSSITQAKQDFISFLWSYEHGEHTMYRRLMDIDYDDWKVKLANRYKELRKTYFKKDDLIQRFVDYRMLFANSGADNREVKRWGISSLDAEINYLDTWISERIDKLDAQYKYVPVPVGIEDNVGNSDNDLSVTGGRGFILLRASTPREVRVHTITGVLIKSVQVDENIYKVDNLSPGVYIINNKKVVVR